MLPDKSTFEAVILPLRRWKLEPDISTLLPLATNSVTSNSIAEPDILPPVNSTLLPVICPLDLRTKLFPESES